jgi:hypothetical protein
MAASIVERGNTVYFAFTFYDENGDAANVDSAEMQITYPAGWGYETETVPLAQSGDEWTATWLSSRARPGWIEWHAHAQAAQYHLVHDGRFRLSGNKAGLDHDRLPAGQPGVGDYSA